MWVYASVIASSSLCLWSAKFWIFYAFIFAMSGSDSSKDVGKLELFFAKRFIILSLFALWKCKSDKDLCCLPNPSYIKVPTSFVSIEFLLRMGSLVFSVPSVLLNGCAGDWNLLVPISWLRVWFIEQFSFFRICDSTGITAWLLFLYRGCCWCIKPGEEPKKVESS